MAISVEEIVRWDEKMKNLFPGYKRKFAGQLRYTQGNLTICIFREDVQLLFDTPFEDRRYEEGMYFSVAQIACVMDKKQEPATDRELLLQFLREHLEELSDYSFCRKCTEKYRKRKNGLLRRLWGRK